MQDLPHTPGCLEGEFVYMTHVVCELDCRDDAKHVSWNLIIRSGMLFSNGTVLVFFHWSSLYCLFTSSHLHLLMCPGWLGVPGTGGLSSGASGAEGERECRGPAGCEGQWGGSGSGDGHNSQTSAHEHITWVKLKQWCKVEPVCEKALLQLESLQLFWDHVFTFFHFWPTFLPPCSYLFFLYHCCFASSAFTLLLYFLLHSLHHLSVIRLQQEHPSFGAVCRLVKRWLGAQLFSEDITEDAADLLVASLFLQPAPFTPPGWLPLLLFW